MGNALLLCAAMLAAPAFVAADQTETVGQRPYEMDWAHRDQDDHPPMIDFEDLAGWRVECQDAQATFERSREQQVWGRYVGKLTYHGTGNSPQVRIVPPQPIAIKEPFDCVTLWVYGNNWGYAPDPKTPSVGVAALFTDSSGGEFAVDLYHVDWTEWYLLHMRLSPEQIARVKAGAQFKGLLVTGGRNKDDRTIFLDNLAVFTERLEPLTFEPRPERGIAMLPGEGVGTNTGPGKLPFPTRPETILPENLTKDFKTTVHADGDVFEFSYAGSDGTMTYRLDPRTGTWGDLTAACSKAATSPGTAFRPCVEGGVYLQTAQGPKLPTKAEHLGSRIVGEPVESRWRLTADEVTAEVVYTYRMWNKSLVIDVAAPGGKVGEVRFGHAEGLGNSALVTLPFYPAAGGRPAVAISGSPDARLFLMGNVDWYLSNASILWAANQISGEQVTYNGGTRYLPKTDGQRNDVHERFFLTVSTRFEEVLPTVANPVSPWKQVTGTHLWRAHGASDRANDARYWTDCHRWGMTQVIITDHETGWRDGGESFTFRTRPAPGKGGDQGQYDYARLMQEKLGFVYGPYNNYTDFAPVNEFWTTDLISRTPENQLQHAWMRCYAPKPARAIEFCARLAPKIQEKFHFSTAYCDVHTAVAPWDRVDYDARVPGAGTFSAVFYAFGEIMLRQKEAWKGPVYSEGNNHAFYCGLTDGNYGQDQAYRPAVNPWLVDFDLRKLHDLCCNFGMGAPDMFYAGAHPSQDTPEQRDAGLDRFLAATVAFGHPGFLTYEGGTRSALRSYYMLQQLHSRYCLAPAAEIRYVDSQGHLLDTSTAVASGEYKRSQVVTRYADGTVTAANGSTSERLTATAHGRALDLPPNGYAGWTADGAISVWSGDRDRHRSDYAETPAYLFVDGRGRFVRHEKAAGNGLGICRVLPDRKFEVLLFEGAECGFAIVANHAVALDKEGKEIGPASLRESRGLLYVMPVKNAFSYILSTDSKGASGSGALTCQRQEVVPGEHVIVQGKETHEVNIPADAAEGQRIWIEQEGRWIDFTVVPLTRTEISVDDQSLRLDVTSQREADEDFVISVGDQSQKVRLQPGKPESLVFVLGKPAEESADVVAINLRSGPLSQGIECGVRVREGYVPLAAIPSSWNRGLARRQKPEQPSLDNSGAIVEVRPTSCGQVTKDGIFMHPPYMGGVGYAFARFESVTLPVDRPAAFRALIGKADGSDAGDGILFKVAVLDEADKESVVATRTVTENAWLPIEADLSPWAGHRVTLKLIADVGPKDDSSGDWACWADMRIENLRLEQHRSLERSLDALRHEPGPHPVAGLTQEVLRKAKSGRLHYDGKGLEGTGERYGSTATLNGIDLGQLAPAGGDEIHGTFQKDVSIDLNPDAIKHLARHNVLTLHNPKGDSFSVRGFGIELLLEDGRTASSDIATATYSQPPEWPHAEGIRVPYGKDIEVELWFRP